MLRTEQQQKRYEYKKAWAKANAAKVRASRAQYEDRNAEKVAEYRNSTEFKKRAVERAIAYNKANPETVKATILRSRRKNKSKVAMRSMTRKAWRIKATPQWANKTRIEALYSLAGMLTSNTGEKWHVDHIVPLTNQLVCGLHVYENLRVVPAIVNLQKSNSFQV